MAMMIGRMLKMQRDSLLNHVSKSIPSQVNQVKSLDLHRVLRMKGETGRTSAATFAITSAAKAVIEGNKLVHLHSDASWFPWWNQTTIAGFIRDDEGNVLQAHYMKLGKMKRGRGDIMLAEAKGVEECAKQCEEMFKMILKELDVVAYCDNQNVVSLIIGGNPEVLRRSAIYGDIKKILETTSKFKSFKIIDIGGQNQNRSADALANWAQFQKGKKDKLVRVDKIPKEIEEILAMEKEQPPFKSSV